MKTVIKNKKEVAKGTLSVDFDLLGKNMRFDSGQFITVKLLNPPYNDSKGSERFFSINNAPNGNEFLTITTRVRDSAFKKSLKEMPIGSEVELGPIEGVFTLPKDTSRPLVLIAGGIGITPFMSMLRYIQNNKLDHKIILIYSNRDRESTPFFEELTNMEKQNPNIKLIMTMTQDSAWTGERRRVDAAFIKDNISSPNSYTYFVAGPSDLVDAMFKELENAGVSSGNIRIEHFLGY